MCTQPVKIEKTSSPFKPLSQSLASLKFPMTVPIRLCRIVDNDTNNYNLQNRHIHDVILKNVKFTIPTTQLMLQ